MVENKYMESIDLLPQGVAVVIRCNLVALPLGTQGVAVGLEYAGPSARKHALKGQYNLAQGIALGTGKMLKWGNMG